MRWAVPVGGEDIDRVVGTVRLRFAGEDEVFDGGDPPKPGEVVWADEEGVTCRRWNWRQGVRTRLTESTSRAYFLFDALPAFDDASLVAAMDDLSARLVTRVRGRRCPRSSFAERADERQRRWVGKVVHNVTAMRFGVGAVTLRTYAVR